MNIPVDCPGCQKRYALPVEHRGKQTRCPACGATIKVPAPPPPPPPPLPAREGVTRAASGAVHNARHLPPVLPPLPAAQRPARPVPVVVWVSAGVACLLVLVAATVTAVLALSARPSPANPGGPGDKAGAIADADGERVGHREVKEVPKDLKEDRKETKEGPKGPKEGRTLGPADLFAMTLPADFTFSDTDATLLKLGSVKHYHNRQLIAPDRPGLHGELMRREATRLVPDARWALAWLIIGVDDLGDVIMKRSQKEAAFVKGLPENLRTNSILAALEGLPARTLPSVEELRQTQGANRIEAYIDAARDNEVKKVEATVAMTRQSANMATLVEKAYGARLGKADLTADGAVRVAAQFGDGITFVRNGRASYLPGWHVRVTNQGSRPLTEVILVGRLRTTGGSSALTPNQARALAINEATGFGDKNAQVKKMFENQNMLSTMPKGGYAYVPVLKPGEFVQLPLGDADQGVVRGGTVAMYCTQGRVAEQALTLTRPTRPKR